VTEMQNQDPTADTDPNEYINQLVQVNSLEQLIDINQTLSGDVEGASSSSGSDSSAEVAGVSNGTVATSSLTETAHRSGVTPAPASPVGGASAAQTTASRRAPGNLGVPGVNAATEKVGHALDGRAHLKPSKGSAIALQ